MTEWLEIGLTVAFVLLAAVFAMIDTAYAAMSRARAKHLVEEGVKGAVRVEQILADPAPTIATAQFLCLTFEALAVATIGVRVYALVDSLAARLLITAAIAVDGKLAGLLGITKLRQLRGRHDLAIIDETLA